MGFGVARTGPMDTVALITWGNPDHGALVVTMRTSTPYVLRRLMRHSRRRGQRVAVVATVLGTALIAASGYLYLQGPEEKTSATPRAPKVSLQPTQPPRDEIPKNFEKFFEGADQDGSVTVTGDPLQNAGTGKTIHKVTITLTADGPMKYVYRTKDGTTAPRTANRQTSMSYELRGPRAVAQAFVQQIGSSTYATCSITVDGERVSTETARKTYQIVACTG